MTIDEIFRLATIRGPHAGSGCACNQCQQAEALVVAVQEIKRLRVNRDHSCTCPHGDATEPMHNHDRRCPIRINKTKRLSPEVAMQRIAAALEASDSLIGDCVGDPVHGHVPGHWVVCPVCVAGRTGRPLEQHLADAELRAALLRACSMLDDAVQLRNDAETWFPEIDKLRRIARPDLPVMAGYQEPRDGQG